MWPAADLLGQKRLAHAGVLKGQARWLGVSMQLHQQQGRGRGGVAISVYADTNVLLLQVCVDSGSGWSWGIFSKGKESEREGVLANSMLRG